MTIANPEPVSEPRLVSIEEVPTVVVRHRGITMDDLPQLFDVGYPALAASGAAITGPAFALYRGDPARAFDLELGFPADLPAPASADGEVAVEPSVLPAGRALTITCFGSYDTLPRGWAVLSAEAAARDLRPTCFYEVYVTEPSPQTDPSTLRTDLFLVV